jgi:HSP20 family protein
MSILMKDPVSPAREFTTMRNRLRRFLEEPFEAMLDLPPTLERRLERFAWSPAFEATESPTEYLLTVELPGVSPENVELSVVDNVLWVKGSKEEERSSENKERTLHLWEREYGKFERSFRFPLPVQEQKVVAEFGNGILTIKVPKADVTTPAPRTIPIAKK